MRALKFLKNLQIIDCFIDSDIYEEINNAGESALFYAL